jgi:hypothetical protein
LEIKSIGKSKSNNKSNCDLDISGHSSNAGRDFKDIKIDTKFCRNDRFLDIDK